jgi:prolyl oligopeptidase PreP (S9A serine peptidase family)
VIGGAEAQSAPLLLRVELKGGHGAGLPLEKALKQTADALTFCDVVLK